MSLGMARPPQVNDPVIVRVGSVWVPRWPTKHTPLKVLDIAERGNGTNFVVISLGEGQKHKRMVSYKYLLAKYVLSQQTAVHQ